MVYKWRLLLKGYGHFLQFFFAIIDLHVTMDEASGGARGALAPLPLLIQ